MCRKRIEKAAYSLSGIKSVFWQCESRNLILILNEQKSSISEIEKAVAKVSHDDENCNADDKDYAKLYECCSYLRDYKKNEEFLFLI